MKTWLASNAGTALMGGAAALVIVAVVVVVNQPAPHSDQPIEIEATQPKIAKKPAESKAAGATVPKTEPTSLQTPKVESPAMPALPAKNDAQPDSDIKHAAQVPDAVPVIDTDFSAPVFDLVRIEADGAAVIAGAADPGARVRIRFGAKIIDTVTADSNGTFVALVDLPTGGGARPLLLEQIVADGQLVPSAETVLVLPTVAVENAAPKIILANASGVSVLQTGAVEVPVAETTSAPVNLSKQEAEAPALDAVETVGLDLSLDTISYDKIGDVVLAGRGSSDQFVRVYVNNKPVEIETVPSDGQWKVVLPAVKEGVYTLRVDAIDQSGAVTARVESPFKRETPQVVAAAGAHESAVTVQPGHTLWALAQERYGNGVKYVQILHANRDRIRNPNLIYPGQVFELPD